MAGWLDEFNALIVNQYTDQELNLHIVDELKQPHSMILKFERTQLLLEVIQTEYKKQTLKIESKKLSTYVYRNQNDRAVLGFALCSLAFRISCVQKNREHTTFY